jgi:hypothetical protein
MKALFAFLVVLACFAGSAAGFAFGGAYMVGSHVSIETSCMLLNLAEEKGFLNRSQRFDVIAKVAASTKLGATARETAGRLRTGCPRR